MTSEKKPFFVPQELQQAAEAVEVAQEVVTTPVVETPTKQVVKDSYLPLVNVVDLPSKFLAYPKGTEILYFPYTFGELKKFSQSRLSVKQTYEFILEGIEVRGMPKEQLTFNDFLFIALLRKLSSVGVNNISAVYKCRECNFENTEHIKLDNLPFDNIDVPELPAHIEIHGEEIEFTPLTVEDFFSLFREGKEKDAVAILAIQCRNIPFKQAYNLIDGANTEDSELLEEINKRFYHGLATMEFRCKNTDAVKVEKMDGVEVEKNVHCDYLNLIELGDPGLIVQPFRGHAGDVKTRIRFGKGSKNKSNSSK